MNIDLGKKTVDHDRVEADDEEKGQEIAKDKETHLRAGKWQDITRITK